jgi:hypothetical protein
MKEVKNQLKKLTGAQFVSNDTLPVRPAIVTVRPQTEPKKAFKALEENHKLVRRYSFDDNGGGYMGL